MLLSFIYKPLTAAADCTSYFREELNAKLLTEMADQSDAIMSAYKESLSSVTNKLGEEKSRSAQTVAERLAARKRLREQRLTREVNDEVLNEVGLGKVSSDII